MRARIFQLHKRSSYVFEAIQDKFAVTEKCQIVALADGATQGFKSEQWASQLVNSFVERPGFDAKDFLEMAHSEAERFRAGPFQYNANPAMASLERTKEKSGATSTFLGVRFSDEGMELISCGDSNVFIFQADQIVGVPFANLDELENNQSFLNTNQILKGIVTPADFFVTAVPLKQDDIVLICSDALSRLLLASPDVLRELIEIKSFEEFLTFCSKYWENKSLQEDDITAIVIVPPVDETILVLPTPDFSFPQEDTPLFTPFFDDSLQNDEAMQEIRSQLFRLEQEINVLKKRSAYQMLLLKLGLAAIAVCVLLGILVCSFPSSVDVKPTTSNRTLPKRSTQMPQAAPATSAPLQQLTNDPSQLSKDSASH